MMGCLKTMNQGMRLSYGKTGKMMRTITTTPERYRGAAIYHSDSDCVEYVQRDGGFYYERVDGFLTLIRDMDTDETIGFKLKGFKFMFKETIQALRLTDAQFVVLMKALETVFTSFAEDITDECKARYDEAFKIASNDNVRLDVVELGSLLAA